MKKLLLLALLPFILCASPLQQKHIMVIAGGQAAPGASGCAADSNCVAYYTYENDWTSSTLTDNKGSNNLTPEGTGTPAYPDYSSTDPLDGTYSPIFATGDAESFALVDSSLSAGFPGKSSGGSTDVSGCTLVRMTSASSNRYVLGKWDINDKRSWALAYDWVHDAFAVFIGYNGGASSVTAYYHDGYVTANRTYSICFAYDDDGGGSGNGDIFMRIFDYYANDAECTDTQVPWKCCTASGEGTCDEDGGGILMSGASETYESTDIGQQMSLDDAEFSIGSGMTSGTPVAGIDGKIDKTYIFNDVLTANEMDTIRTTW